VENVWIYDLEVFKEDWIAIFHSIDHPDWDRVVIHNQPKMIRTFLDDIRPVLGGYNNKWYDKWILKCMYHQAPNTIVKACNDWIIGGENGWTFPWLNNLSNPPINQFDLMDDISVPLRLKEVEANLKMDIQESTVPFDLDRPLTEQELEEVIAYCHHDVTATVALFGQRRSYLESKIAVGQMKDIPWDESMSMTNAKLTARFLGAQHTVHNDEFVYEFPSNLLVLNQTVRDFFSRIDYESTCECDIAGTPHVVAWGGLHGARKNYQEEATKDRTIACFDVASYYPSLMIVNGYMSRNIPNPEEFKQVYYTRLKAKKEKNKAVADALKLVLNTTYGAMKNQYNDLFDPRMANAVCISGQLYLIDLIEKLEWEIPELTLIQSNTDGIIISYPANSELRVRAMVTKWEERTGFSMEQTWIKKIYQKDVNNYVMLDDKDHVKVKGGYVSNFEGGTWMNASLPIVAKAVVDTLLYGIPVEQTINECDDPMMFQMIAKTGRTYDKTILKQGDKEVEVQSTNRVFATKDTTAGTIVKVKIKPPRMDSVANAPEHCYIDNSADPKPYLLDKQWYINQALSRVNDYLGAQKSKGKKGKKSMATASNKTTASLAKKLMALRVALSGYSWEKDGKNIRQSYSYITEAQYKRNFQKALLDVGLDYRIDITDYRFIESISDKMHLILANYDITITDPDTGESQVYKMVGSGADNGDKAIYKAETGAIKFFLASNFLVAENNDPESDAEEVQKEKPRHVTAETKTAIKDKMMDQSQPATKEQIATLMEGIQVLMDMGNEELAGAFAELAATEGLTKEQVEEAIEAIGGALA
jgi:hypothetical protein